MSFILFPHKLFYVEFFIYNKSAIIWVSKEKERKNYEHGKTSGNPETDW